MGAHPGGLYGRVHAGRALRRGPRVLGRGAGRQPARRLRRLDPRVGARRRPTTTTTWPSSARSGSAAAGGACRPRLVAGRRGGPPARPRRAAERLGAGRGARGPGPRRPDRGHRRRRACWPAPAWPTWRRGWRASLARRRGVVVRAHRRARAVGLRADARPIRSCSTTAASRPPRCWPTRRRSSAWSCRAGHHDAGLPRRGDRRRHGQHRLDGRSRDGRSSWAPVAATTWPSTADEVIVMTTLTGAAHGGGSRT